MNEELKNIDFETYEQVVELHKRESVSAWRAAIGLQDVDGLRVSEYLKKTAVKHIEGDIIQQLKPSEMEQVIISKQQKAIQETISAKIRNGFVLKADGEQSLNEAKIIVEMEIKKGGE